MKKWTVVICVLALFLAGCSKEDAAVPTTAPETTAPTTQTAPVPEAPTTLNFTVYNAGGEPVEFADYLGKPIVLNFWASWCPPCKNEMPTFQQVYEELGDRVQFLMIDIGEQMDDAQAFLSSTGYTFPVLFDVNGEAAYAYQISAIPATFFLSAAGEVVDSYVGAMPESELRTAIAKIDN